VATDVGSQIFTIGQSQGALAAEPQTSHLDLKLPLWRPCKAPLEVLAELGNYALVYDASDPCVIGLGKIPPTDLTATEVVTAGVRYSHPSGVMGYPVDLRCEMDAVPCPAISSFPTAPRNVHSSSKAPMRRPF
jgi:hypothetical protein